MGQWDNGEIHTAPSVSQKSSSIVYRWCQLKPHSDDHDEDVGVVLILVTHDHASNIATLRVWKLKAPYNLHDQALRRSINRL
ncbi:hypothetical protein E4U58_004449 [Claviceps cyperi]|nr:hypothetical protein E4U58_004449 [Claviceps cyperi]